MAMATVKDEVEQLARELGVEVNTRNLKEAQLNDLLAQLRAQKGNSPTTPQASAQAPAAYPNNQNLPAPEEGSVRTENPAPNAPLPIDGAAPDATGGAPIPATPPVQVRYPFQVAPGRSITTHRGLIDAGQEIKATDFVQNEKDVADGQKRLDELVKQGVILKRDDAGDAGKPRP